MEYFILFALNYVNMPRGDATVSLAGKNFIFAYPLSCVMIRFLLRPVIYVKFLRNFPHGELIKEYISNYLCFVALSLELFTILFVYGALKNVAAVLLVDTAALIGILIVGMAKINLSCDQKVRR